MKEINSNFIAFCCGGYRKFSNVNEALSFAKEKECKNFNVRIYVQKKYDLGDYDILYCVYYTGINFNDFIDIANRYNL